MADRIHKLLIDGTESRGGGFSLGSKNYFNGRHTRNDDHNEIVDNHEGESFHITDDKSKKGHMKDGKFWWDYFNKKR